MSILSIAIIIFIVLESLNVLTLYFNPGSRFGNGVGVFNAWEKSKADPEMHQFVRYLVFWVAGTKLIFIALLLVILGTAGESTKLLTVVAMIASISSFFWRLFPIIKTLDKAGHITPSGYSKTLRMMIAGFIGLFAMALALMGFQWVTHERQLVPEAMEALESDSLVTVTQQPWLTFTPAESHLTGFIFYPGGRIAPQGYAPLMRVIASEGYLVAVPEMPLNIAAFRPNIADEIIAAHPEIERWVISGHSVGGAMAAQYTYTHPDDIAGLAIWASYPPDQADLSDLEIPVTLIYGSRETRVTDSSLAERRHLLPAHTVYVRIEGGDHHQFGAYEINPDEHLATISPEAQHEQIIRATLDLLTLVSDTG